MSLISSILNRVERVLESAPRENHTAKLSRDLIRLIASKLSDSLDLLALGKVNREWCIGANYVCRTRIEMLFGKKLIGKREPLKVAAQLWEPLTPSTDQLKPRYLKGNPDKVKFPKGCKAFFKRLDDSDSSVKQLQKALEILKNKHGVTLKSFPLLGNLLFDSFVFDGDRKKICHLIELGATYTVVSKKSESDAFDHYLITAARQEHFNILQLLLQHGASLNLNVRSTYEIYLGSEKDAQLNLWSSGEPIKLFYEIFNILFLATQNESNFLCVAVAMRSWRYEVGIEAMRNDKLLSKIAGKFIIFKIRSSISKLFSTYGILPDFIDADILRVITLSVINGEKDHLEYYNTQGLLDYQGFRTENGFTLADLALSYGQFELETFFVNEKGVAYSNYEQAHELLAQRSCNAFKSFIEENNKLMFKFESRQYDLTRLLLIIDHYNIEVDIPDENGETPLFIRCRGLLPNNGGGSSCHKKISMGLNTIHLLPSNQRIAREWDVIEALVHRKANLLIKNNDQTPADFIDRFVELYRRKDTSAEALPNKEKALEICRKYLGEDHPCTALGYNNLSTNLGDLGRYAEALQYSQKALEIHTKNLTEDQPLTASYYNNVGVSWGLLGKYAEALQFKQKALEILIKTLGKDHPSSVLGYLNVGGSLLALGRYVEALHHQETALKICRENGSNTALCYNDIGVCLFKIERWDEALHSHQKALQIRRKILGEAHPATTASYKNVISILEELGKRDEALQLRKQARAIRKQLEEDNPFEMCLDDDPFL